MNKIADRNPTRVRGTSGNFNGHRCPTCGKTHLWSPYVFAHFHVQLSHTCDCGFKSVLLDGRVRRA